MALKNLLTVDVEDWYHICDVEHILPRSSWDKYESRLLFNLEKILNLLSRYKVKATFFTLGYVAERNPEAVKMIDGEGHEISSHGYGHLQVYKQTREEFLDDLIKARNLIEPLTKKKVTGYRAPQWSICKGRRESFWALDVLVQSGFHYDSSIAPLRFIGIPKAPHTPYTIPTPHGVIREFPPLIMPSPLGNLPIGGGWGLRIIPYGIIRRSIEALNRNGHPGLIFLHPSDFDSYRPPVRLPWIKRFVCYGKIRSTEERLIQLLNDFEFTTVREVLVE